MIPPALTAHSVTYTGSPWPEAVSSTQYHRDLETNQKDLACVDQCPLTFLLVTQHCQGLQGKHLACSRQPHQREPLPGGGCVVNPSMAHVSLQTLFMDVTDDRRLVFFPESRLLLTPELQKKSLTQMWEFRVP